MIRAGFIISLLISLSACLPEPLEVDNVPIPERTIVIGSQDIPGEFLAVSVSRNFTALDGGPQSDFDSLVQDLLIDSLNLFIDVQGVRYSLDFSPVRGLYLGSDVPEIPGEIYTLSTNNPFNDALTSASTELMPFIGFDSLRLTIEETPFDTLMHIDLRIGDPPGPNWYMINVQTFNDEYSLEDRPFTEVISDEDFDGQLYDYGFKVFFNDYGKGDTVLVSMANIEKEYYDFLQLRFDQRYLLLDGLGEPITYPTNVLNGLGYFHLHIPDVRLITPD